MLMGERDNLCPMKYVAILGLALAGAGFAQDSATLEAVRKYALTYARNLPDYTCSQVTNRILNRGTATRDVFEEDLSFVGGKESYKVTKVNGFAATKTAHEELGGATSQGEFGSLLRHIFDPDTRTIFRAGAQEKLQGRVMNVFTFRVPQAKGYSIYDGQLKRMLLLAYEGSIYADPETNAVMRLSMKCVGFPGDTALSSAELTLEYKATQLSKQTFILARSLRADWTAQARENRDGLSAGRRRQHGGLRSSTANSRRNRPSILAARIRTTSRLAGPSAT